MLIDTLQQGKVCFFFVGLVFFFFLEGGGGGVVWGMLFVVWVTSFFYSLFLGFDSVRNSIVFFFLQDIHFQGKELSDAPAPLDYH